MPYLLCIVSILSLATAFNTTISVRQNSGEDRPEPLKFSEFFEISGSQLRPSARLMSLRGRRVRIVGYMARMEEPLKGAFYLCPRPVYGDESGGGTADLPVETVLVIVNSAKDKWLEYFARPLEVVGLLEIIEPGREAPPGGRIRITLEEPATRQPAGKLKRP